MDITAVRGRGARLFAVLAVLVGLLAMHGVAGAHHAAATSVTGHAAMPSDAAMAAGAAHRQPVVQHAAAGPTVVALAGRQVPSCGDGCGGVAALCVAVLVGAALALLLAHRRAPLLLCAPARPRAHGPAPPVQHARGPDPVRELCVSRT